MPTRRHANRIALLCLVSLLSACTTKPALVPAPTTTPAATSSPSTNATSDKDDAAEVVNEVDNPYPSIDLIRMPVIPVRTDTRFSGPRTPHSPSESSRTETTICLDPSARGLCHAQ